MGNFKGMGNLNSINQPHILVYHPTEANHYADFIQKHGYNAAVASTPSEASLLLHDTEVLFCWGFPNDLLSSLQNTRVRWIQAMGAGVDNLINNPDFPKQIRLTRVVGLFGGAIAEYVFGYLLYWVKDINKMEHDQKEQKWHPFFTDFLAGKKIGIAGLGSIGLEIVRKARAFDMVVYGLSYSGKQAHLVDRHFVHTEWREFVQELDYLVLTLPLTDETKHLVNREILLSLPSEASLINVGRGALIQEQALIDVLQSGHLKAAVLDVFEQEPLQPDHSLWTLPNVWVTPHISGPSIPENVGHFFLDNLQRYIQRRPLVGLVSVDSGY